VELRCDYFKSLLVDKINQLTTHHYVSKSQSKSCRELKANLPVNHCLLQGDFSPNAFSSFHQIIFFQPSSAMHYSYISCIFKHWRSHFPSEHVRFFRLFSLLTILSLYICFCSQLSNILRVFPQIRLKSSTLQTE
jgi:hypothetical protein